MDFMKLSKHPNQPNVLSCNYTTIEIPKHNSCANHNRTVFIEGIWTVS